MVPAARGLLSVGPALGLLLALSLVACDRGRPAGDEAVRTDSAGIEIVTSFGPAWPAESTPIVTTPPRVRIGAADGPPETQLFRAVDAAVLEDGRIVVANAGTHELRLYAPDGRFLRALGGEGDGPGEFRALQGVAVGPADTIIGWDQQARRVSLFTPEGGFARSVTLEPPGERSFPLFRGRFGDGSYLVSAARFVSEPPEDGEVMRGTMQYLRYGVDGTPLAPLAELPARPSYVRTRTEGGRIVALSFRSAPFEVGHAAAAGPDGLYAGTGASYEIRVIGLDGRTRRIARRTVEAPRVAEVGEALIEEELRDVEDAEERRLRAEAYARIPAPERVPAFDALRVGEEGRLWVRRFRDPGEEGRRWDLFAPDGRWLGTVRTPPGLEVYRAGPSYVLGRTRDELDVERIELYELRVPEPD